jgi:outer membrane protein assembly factor BamA
MKLLLLALCMVGLGAAQDQTVVRSIRFEHFKKVRQADIVNRLNEREVRLQVERPYHLEDAEQARRYIVQLLAEKGKPNARIEIATHAVAPHQVEVTFKLLR